ncbi:cell morphogenesis C-terminal-domain-containing protein [Cokeromyces recurvatus]|uniref:cell morphogenesis C-terminal-domain-containing protein n=1 Tax=Cokeromyces recurvatus TaxID=90255 RepID=UPI0022211FBF|nr:cell morphogenesis C-terminal-domain-containing protein [Cokeromyces recurvatus]KAI7898548.1 cell morphogenesis C-terminal-domain-containing protein [Cokeromyces recurvatus]
MEHIQNAISKTLSSLDQTFGRLLVLDEKNIIRGANYYTLQNNATTTTAATIGSLTTATTTTTTTTAAAAAAAAAATTTITTAATGTITTTATTSTSTAAATTTTSTSTAVATATTNVNYSVPIFTNTNTDGGAQIYHAYATFSVSYTKDKQPYFDVIKTILEGIPRVMPTGIPLQQLVDMLARYSVHTDPDVVGAATSALLRIASQIDSQTVLVGFSNFISKIEDKFWDIVQSLAIATTSGFMILYVELLKIWIDQHDQLNHDVVQLIEANALLFLCHQSAWVRKFAVQIIEIVGRKLATTTTTTEWSHLYDMLLNADLKTQTSQSNEIRNRLTQHQRHNVTFLQIAASDHPLDITIWNAWLPTLCKLCFKHFPKITAMTRSNMCERILQIQPSILALVETATATGTLSIAKNSQRAASVDQIDQWRIYLVFSSATTIITTAHSFWPRKSTVVDISTPRDFFRLLVPYLTSEHRQVREAVIEGLGHINHSVYHLLLSELEPYLKTILDDGKQRNNQKPYQNKRSKKNDRLRISLMNLLELTAPCLLENTINNAMDIIMSYIKETKSFLMDTEVQIEWEYQRLRIHLCGLVDKLYEGIMRLEDPSKVMSFETRLSLYKMFEEWCGYGVAAKTAQQREATMMRDVLEQCKDLKERASMTQVMEEERKTLELASLSAMATLLRGPLYAYLGQKKARQAIIQFDTLNILNWIDAMFESRDPKYHAIARRALEEVMMYNQDQLILLDDIIEQCYAGNPKLEFTQGYFHALAEIVIRVEDYPCHIHQIMSLALFKTGDNKKAIRKTAIQLLRVIEERVFADSCAKEYEIGITSSLPAIYKHTQTLLSARLALDHPEQTYSMLSEITQRFEHISPNSQREVLTYMLPWHRKVDLMVGPHDTDLSASAYMVLSNLYYLTVKFGDIYVKETAALWSQLVEYGRNVRAIIMYLLDMGQETRNPWFLIHAKRIFVCLGRTHAFAAIMEEVLAEITPRSMVPQLKEASQRHLHAFPLLFVADAQKVLPTYPKKPVFSRGQLAMVFLVDLAIEAGAELAPHLPLLLHCIFIQLDHLISIICDQSRCFLINLIHSIVVRQSIDSESSQRASEVIQWLVEKEGKRLWAYENLTPKNRRIASANELKQLLQRVVDVFSNEDPDLRQKWGETALKWATCCSVRHIACRSFQCFRALMPAFNGHMLADMLARLSNTIADRSEDIRGFALEIILTLTDVAKSMDDLFPQLFWAAVACLYSPYESEHCEALHLLGVVLEKLEMPKLIESFPKNWSCEFDGLQPLLLKGLQFSSVEEDTFRVLNLISLQEHLPLIDPNETRLMYLLLGSIPRLLHGLDGETVDAEAMAWSQKLVLLFEGFTDMQRILSTYPIQKGKFQQDYLKQILSGMRPLFLTKYCQQAFMFALLLVKNKIPYYREKSLLLIESLVPYVTGQMMGMTPVSIDIAALEPLLQLISTEYADRAITILNSGIQTSHGGDLIWGLNNFTEAARITRHNIYSVVLECSTNVPIEPNIQFSVEDLSMLTGEPSQVNGLPSVTYGNEIMNALKDLDDFFNEDGEPMAPPPLVINVTTTN